MKKDKFEDLNIISKTESSLLDSFKKSNLKQFDIDNNVVKMFETQAKNSPNNISLVYQNESVTFKQVKEYSDAIATNLIKKGYQKGDIACIFLPRNQWTPIVALGIVKAGLAFEPLDAIYPDERLAFMAEDSKAKVMFTVPELAKRIPKHSGEKIYLEEVKDFKPQAMALPEISPHDLFVILYTSGSTGVPKGVLLEHCGFTYFIQEYIKEFKLTPKTHMSSYASFGFDAGVDDMFNALSSDATLYIVDEAMRLDLKKTNDYIEKNKVSFAFFTTQVARQLVTDYPHKYLKTVITGGEKLVPFQVPSTPRIVNAYGPTEATVFMSSESLKKIKYYRIPIGKPIEICKTYIVDKNLKELPYGVPGELLIAGAQVARGYLNRDEETKKHFAVKPFTKDPSFQRIYRTGDVVRYLKDGRLDIIGRKDSQVKVRGFRIELSEVEEIIRKFQGIKDATVIALPDPNGGMYIASYVVSDQK
ncbi:MAG: amino acid adenylation domain-containing protein [Bacilli bacterium]